MYQVQADDSSEEEKMMKEQEYFTQFGIMTDPGNEKEILSALPDHMRELTLIVQGLMTHIFWGWAYGYTIPEERKAEVQLRSMKEKLERIRILDGSDYRQPRSIDRKLIGNCRDFSVMLASILKAKGVPARARCGFGTYFTPGQYEDHWVCEYWNKEEERWILTDAQLDDVQREKLNVTFDPLDVPRDQFITGGDAWKLCRNGAADPEKFGIFGMNGWMFILGNLFRDQLSLNNVEILPWDGWGIMSGKFEDLKNNELLLLDDVASISGIESTDFLSAQRMYIENPALQIPDTFLSYRMDGSFEEIDLEQYHRSAANNLSW